MRSSMSTAAALVRCALIFAPAIATAQRPAPDLCTGHWIGAIELPTMKLDFDIDLTRRPDGDCAGDISIPVQNARDVALADVTVRGDSIRFTMTGVPGSPTFAGARTADGRTVRGTFSQGPGSFPFTMAAGPAPAAAASAALAGFDAWVDSAVVAWKVVGLSVGITVDGEPAYLKGHGLRNRERQLPVTPQTMFAIGSSSKAFTTFAMGALVEQGRLKWDVPVRTYIPWFRMHDESVTQRITPRDLVTHRSGLPRHDLLWYNSSVATREQLVRRVAHLPLNRDLRETFQYNNLMYLTAGYLVGELTGASWEDGLRELVLEPLGMRRTNFSVRESQADADHSVGYLVRRDTVQGMPFRDISLVGPAGSINSTAEDMLKWVGLHMAGGKIGDRQVMQEATLRDMYRPYMPVSGIGENPELGPMSYGLGWFVDTYRGRYRVQHGGNIDGFTAAVQMLPRERIGIVVLINQNGSPLGELIARHAMDRLLGDTRRDWSGEARTRQNAAVQVSRQAEAHKAAAQVPNTRTAHPLAAYVATYADSGYGDAAITVVRDTLVFSFNGIEARLRHFHYETFAGIRNPLDPTFEDFQVTFRTSPAGRVDAMRATMDAMVPAITFERQADTRMRDPAFLDRIVGRYRNPILDISVTRRANALAWSQNNGPATMLEPVEGMRFRPAGIAGLEIEFLVDSQGRVTAARVFQMGTVIDFPRADGP
ncbi:MAG: serine hydrolase [Gemmatimonadaceae bacterium]|nr:serine hydrolase [Gemmatimonadaceae bacterium]